MVQELSAVWIPAMDDCAPGLVEVPVKVVQEGPPADRRCERVDDQRGRQDTEDDDRADAS